MLHSSFSTRILVAAAALWLAGALGAPLDAQRGGGPGGGRGQGSPASQRPPETTTPQTYPPELVEAGRARFAAQCGFCHGRDANGAEGGTDLTRSQLVAEDVRGSRIGPLVRTGRIDRGMPAFSLSEDDLAAIVAFIHHQKDEADSAVGGRRSVDVADLQTGNLEAGRQYFDRTCARCHSATGDLAGIGRRYEGLPLLQRLLYPGTGGRGGPPPRPTATVTTASGEVVTGPLAFHDGITIALTDSAGWYRSWPVRQVKVRIDDPLQAHVEQLGRYTDADLHNVFGYLQSLK